MMDTPTIIVPLDGSPLSREALPYAEALARLWGCSLTLFGVVEPEGSHLFGPSAVVVAQLQRLRREGLAEQLGRQAEALGAEGLAAAVEVVDGDPAEAIVAAAAERAARAIVLATRGQGGLQRLVLGSVADKVLRTAPCPVLMTTPRGEHAGRPPLAVRFRRILVPLDGSTLAEAALPVAAQLAAAADATVVLVRVEPSLARRTAVYPYVPELGEVEQEITRMVSQYLERARQKLPAGLRVEVLVRRGEPSLDLVDLALDHAIDLVVMTTHGRGGLRRLVLGSVADRLVRAGAPVLLLRSTNAGDAVEDSGVGAAASGAPGEATSA